MFEDEYYGIYQMVGNDTGRMENRGEYMSIKNVCSRRKFCYNKSRRMKVLKGLDYGRWRIGGSTH